MSSIDTTENHTKPILFTVIRNGHSSRVEYAPWFRIEVFTSKKYNPDLTERWRDTMDYLNMLMMGTPHGNVPPEEKYALGVQYIPVSEIDRSNTGYFYGMLTPDHATYIIKRGDTVVFPTWTLEIKTSGDIDRLVNNLEMESVLQ